MSKLAKIRFGTGKQSVTCENFPEFVSTAEAVKAVGESRAVAWINRAWRIYVQDALGRPTVEEMLQQKHDMVEIQAECAAMLKDVAALYADAREQKRKGRPSKPATVVLPQQAIKDGKIDLAELQKLVPTLKIVQQ